MDRVLIPKQRRLTTTRLVLKIVSMIHSRQVGGLPYRVQFSSSYLRLIWVKVLTSTSSATSSATSTTTSTAPKKVEPATATVQKKVDTQTNKV